MWYAISEEDISCRECFHVIPKGNPCLSQLPVDMPQGFQRGKFDNFCINCLKCKDKTERSCYARGLSHWSTLKQTLDRPVPCAACSSTIPKGTQVVAQKFYIWPEFEPTPDNVNSASTRRNGPFASGAAATVTGTSRQGIGGWEALSSATKRRFRAAGLGGSRGSRSEVMARRLYERIPKEVSNLGEGAVNEFMKGKHASHIKSVANSPSMSKQPHNIAGWEKASKNAARGSRNMTAKEVAATKSTARSAAINVGLKSVIRSAARAGVIASAIEAPIAGLENFFHWRRGRKTSSEAIGGALKSVAVTGAVVGVVGGGIGLARMAGLAIPLGPFGTPLAIIGGAWFAISAIRRIFGAAKRDLPLYECLLYFCKGSVCKTKFAEGLTAAGRQEAG